MPDADGAQGSQYQAKITSKKVDVSKVAEVESWIGEVIEDHGKLDGAANIAGIAGGEGQITEDIVRTGRPLQHSTPPVSSS